MVGVFLRNGLDAYEGAYDVLGASVFWWESGGFDDGAIALVGVEEVVGWVVLNPEEHWGVLTKACFEV